MNVFMLLVLVQLSSGAYDTKMAPMKDMAECVAKLPEIVKVIPKEEGISYSLTCIQIKDTMEQPA
ncbi:MAG TPA: hypothetical protein VIY48_02210 [Candidatus Paceibacterota bacterium]